MVDGGNSGNLAYPRQSHRHIPVIVADHQRSGHEKIAPFAVFPTHSPRLTAVHRKLKRSDVSATRQKRHDRKHPAKLLLAFGQGEPERERRLIGGKFAAHTFPGHRRNIVNLGDAGRGFLREFTGRRISDPDFKFPPGSVGHRVESLFLAEHTVPHHHPFKRTADSMPEISPMLTPTRRLIGCPGVYRLVSAEDLNVRRFTLWRSNRCRCSIMI